MTTPTLEEMKAEVREALYGWTINVLEHEIEREYIRKFIDYVIESTITTAKREALREVREKLKSMIEEIPADACYQSWTPDEVRNAEAKNDAITDIITHLESEFTI